MVEGKLTSMELDYDRAFRGTLLIRNCLLLGPYSGGPCLGPYGGPGWYQILMSEVPLYGSPSDIFICWQPARMKERQTLMPPVLERQRSAFSVLSLRTTTLQQCVAVPRRARM